MPLEGKSPHYPLLVVSVTRDNANVAVAAESKYLCEENLGLVAPLHGLPCSFGSDISNRMELESFRERQPRSKRRPCMGGCKVAQELLSVYKDLAYLLKRASELSPRLPLPNGERVVGRTSACAVYLRRLKACRAVTVD